MTLISIVVYDTPKEILSSLLLSLSKLDRSNFKVILVDNKSSIETKKMSDEFALTYISTGSNLGFGKAHNLAFKTFESKYFCVLNPDIDVEASVFSNLENFMNQNQSVPLCSPKILNIDGSLQRVHKRLPTFQLLFLRRFLSKYLSRSFKRKMELYELHDQDLNRRLCVPNISGCFMFFRSEAFSAIEGFDENIFLYLEDADISRRANAHGPLVVVGDLEAKHHWQKASHKSWRLTLINIVSAFYYFKKWGLRGGGEVTEYIG